MYLLSLLIIYFSCFASQEERQPLLAKPASTSGQVTGNIYKQAPGETVQAIEEKIHQKWQCYRTGLDADITLNEVEREIYNAYNAPRSREALLQLLARATHQEWHKDYIAVIEKLLQNVGIDK